MRLLQYMQECDHECILVHAHMHTALLELTGMCAPLV